MIESGSHTPNVDPALFGLPPHTALRFELPDARLSGLVADYHVFDSEGPAGKSGGGSMLPARPAIRIILAKDPIAAELDGIRYDPLPEAALYGATSGPVGIYPTNGGVTIGISLTAAGFARLFGSRAREFRDRIIPLETHWGHAQVNDLVARLRNSDQGKDVKSILDKFLVPMMSIAHRSEAQLHKLAALLLDPAVERIEDAAKACGIPDYTLRRLATRHFGFPPKLLHMRARFLRTMLAIREAASGGDYSAIDLAYCDTSHFIRHSRRFLSTTPQRFLKQENPYVEAVLRARTIVTGQALAALSPSGPLSQSKPPCLARPPGHGGVVRTVTAES